MDESTAKRAVESTEDFKLRLAAIVREKREHIEGARRARPLLVRKPRTQKRRRR